MDTGSLVSSTVDAEHLARWPWGLSMPMVRHPGVDVVWTNRRLPFAGGERALLDEFAWHVPPARAPLAPHAETKTFYAECYGGDGIHHNGGGVRCAWSGDWLVKGIGINLLSGYSDEDAAQRRNGRGSVCEMLVEAIWGEVLTIALPFGAVRLTAVLKTDERLPDQDYPTGGTGIREFISRPAHFMRAWSFHVRPEHRAKIPSDTARVRQAIAQLPAFLPFPAAMSDSEIAALSPQQRLKAGLEEMVRRFAEQLAAARAKRLSHGTVTSSNICIDGRWNDLNSVSTLPGYGYRRNFTPFWAEHLAPLKIMDQLCFYISKYFPKPSDGATSSGFVDNVWLRSRYGKFYDEALARRFVELCGFPQIVADRVWARAEGRREMEQLSRHILHLAKAGYSARRPFHDDFENTTVVGKYDVRAILRRVTAPSARASGDVALDDLIGELPLRTAFIRRYGIVAKLMHAEACEQGISTLAFSRLVAFNCHKSGRDMPFLFRHVMFERCKQLVETNPDVESLRQKADELVESVVNEARVVYQEPVNFTTLLWCEHGLSLEYDACADGVFVQSRGGRFRLRDNAGADVVASLRAMTRYWGKAYEEIMQ